MIINELPYIIKDEADSRSICNVNEFQQDVCSYSVRKILLN